MKKEIKHVVKKISRFRPGVYFLARLRKVETLLAHFPVALAWTCCVGKCVCYLFIFYRSDNLLGFFEVRFFRISKEFCLQKQTHF